VKDKICIVRAATASIARRQVERGSRGGVHGGDRLSRRDRGQAALREVTANAGFKGSPRDAADLASLTSVREVRRDRSCEVHAASTC